MFFKKFKISFTSLLLLIIIMPISVFAYSDYIIPGGENIGIEINSKDVVVIGTYEVNGSIPAKDAGIQIGDIIKKVGNKTVTNIDELVTAINDSSDSVEITYSRNNKEYKTQLKIFKEDGVSKTGLYVKDSITGIGTLSYIDPNTLVFGALGHEVIESNSGQTLEVKDGTIVKSTVTNVERSENGNPGSKNAELKLDDAEGNITENTPSGIFGKYTGELPNKQTKKIAKADDIKIGEAKILTVIEGSEIKEYTINIIKINKNAKDNKNILFEITDKELLEKTGGVVQGMSGSPIIQGDYIIGAVTHVVVDNPTRGYGIFITNMLEEGEN